MAYGSSLSAHAAPRSTAAQHLRYRPDIDGLRAIAVGSVVVFHAFPHCLPGGFVGVDVFFVISGYLISRILLDGLEKGTFSFRDFFAHRVRRIFPALILVLIASLMAGWFAMLAYEYKEFGKHVAAGAGFVSNLVLWGEAGYFDTAAETKPLLHLWSLGIEEQFYIFWPLMLWLWWKWRLPAVYLIVIVAMISFLMNLRGVLVDPVGAFYSPLTRFWELLVGSFLAWVTLHSRGSPTTLQASLGPIRWSAARRADRGLLHALLPLAMSVTGLGLVAIAITTFDSHMPFPGALALVPTVGAALVIAAGPNALPNRALLSLRPAVWLGLISYPLYLWHWPLLSFVSILEQGHPDRITRVAAVLLAVLLAALTYMGVEKRIRSGKFGKNITAALVVAMTGVGLVGVTTYLQDGFIDRFPAEVRMIQEMGEFPTAPLGLNRKCHRFKESETLQLCVDDKRPLIFLMGDSHAEKLFIGLNGLKSTYVFGLDTATGCGNIPLLTPGHFEDEQWCDTSQKRLEFNQFALAHLADVTPEIVILHARWANEGYFLEKDLTLRNLVETIRQIAVASPESKIVVVGPVPNWTATPMRALVDHWQHAADQTQLPERLTTGQVPDIAEWDDFLRAGLSKMDVVYISAYRVFCNSEGCLARVGQTASDVTGIDTNHLSPAGAEFLVEHIRDDLFSLLGKVPDFVR